MGKEKPQRIAGVSSSTKRVRAMNRLLICVSLCFAVVVVFFSFRIILTLPISVLFHHVPAKGRVLINNTVKVNPGK